MGDFNIHSNVWGCRDTDQKGRIVDVINRNNLLLYNNKSYTYLHPGTGTYSAIDLTFADSSFFLDYSWKVHDDTRCSEGSLLRRFVGPKVRWSELYTCPSFMFVADSFFTDQHRTNIYR